MRSVGNESKDYACPIVEDVITRLTHYMCFDFPDANYGPESGFFLDENIMTADDKCSKKWKHITMRVLRIMTKEKKYTYTYLLVPLL